MFNYFLKAHHFLVILKFKITYIMALCSSLRLFTHLKQINMTKKTILLIVLTLSYINILAEEAKPCLFIGIYNSDKKFICSNKTWIREEIKDRAEFEQKRLQFKEAHKNDESFSTSTEFVSDKQCVIVYEYKFRISSFDCNPIAIGIIKGATIEICKEQLATKIAKNPNHFLTQPHIVFSKEASPSKPVIENKPDIGSEGGNTDGGGGTPDGSGFGSSGNTGNPNENTNRFCPTYGFKISNNNPSYNCVALEWWSLSTKSNMIDASGNFKQSTEPQAKSFTIEFRRQGDIYWTIEKRENTGRNAHTISGLDACTKYEIRLIATCDNNQDSAPTNIMRFTTACNKPGKLTVENITNNAAKINSERLTGSVTYPCASSASTQVRIIEFKTSAGAWQEVICNSGSPCFLYTLSPGTIYKVRARYKYGTNLFSNYTNEISFTTSGN